MNDCTFVLIVEPSRKQNANGAKWEGAGARSAWLPGWKGPHLWPLLHSQRRALTQILKSALPSSAQESPMAPEAWSQVCTHPSALEALGSHPVCGSGLLLASLHPEPSAV